jgi:hypothetical protein
MSGGPEDPVQRSFVLDTDRGEHAIGAHERVHREQPEVRRRVDHDVVVAAENRFKSFVWEPLSAELPDETHLEPRPARVHRNHVQAVNARHDGVVGAGAAGERPDEDHTEPRPNGELFARSIASSKSLTRQIGSAGPKTSSWAIGESVGGSTTTVSWKKTSRWSASHAKQRPAAAWDRWTRCSTLPLQDTANIAQTHRGISPRPMHAAHRAR